MIYSIYHLRYHLDFRHWHTDLTVDQIDKIETVDVFKDDQKKGGDGNNGGVCVFLYLIETLT